MTTTRRLTRSVLGATLAAALLALSACGGGDGSDEGSGKAAEEPTSQESSADAGEQGPQPDLEGIPDVVAEVNGEEVTRDEFVAVYEPQFQQAAMQAQMSGQEPDEDALKKQTAENLVDTELLAQEADSRGLEVTDDDIDAELTTIAEQNQLGSAKELLDALAKQGTSEEQARSQVEVQVMVEQLVADESGPVEPTEKELRDLYAQAKKGAQAQAEQQGGKAQEIPPFAKVRDQLEEQATSQEVGKVAQELVDGLRKDADITINL
jgi:peptidyl-prolyl cis-trans isomerase SurA